MKSISRIGLLEKKYIMEVLEGQFSSSNNYKMVTRFEQAFSEKIGCKYGIAMVNGTATLHIALEACGVGIGDEVICPPLTMSSTSLAVLHANATPVFADVDKDTFEISVDGIEKVITEKTKAIIVVSLFGLSPDMDAIMEVAHRHNLTVIEDNAQCYLSKYKGKMVGTLGDMASYSFQSSKHLTAGEGGIVVTDDPDLALKLRQLSGLGYGNIGLDKGRITKNDIQNPNYNRHIILGWNYRPSDLCGAVMLAQTERIEELIEMRSIAAKHLIEAMQGFNWLIPQRTPPECENSYWTVSALLDINRIPWVKFRSKFIEFGGDGIYSAWKLSYLEPAFKNKNFSNREKVVHIWQKYMEGLCPNAEYIQPRLLQFKTNYWDESEAIHQARILRETLDYFESNI